MRQESMEGGRASCWAHWVILRVINSLLVQFNASPRASTPPPATTWDTDFFTNCTNTCTEGNDLLSISCAHTIFPWPNESLAYYGLCSHNLLIGVGRNAPAISLLISSRWTNCNPHQREKLRLGKRIPSDLLAMHYLCGRTLYEILPPLLTAAPLERRECTIIRHKNTHTIAQ